MMLYKGFSYIFLGFLVNLGVPHLLKNEEKINKLQKNEI